MEQETTVHHVSGLGGEAVRLGSVRLVVGPVVIARLGDGALVGARVSLGLDARGAVWAHPAKPQPPGALPPQAPRTGLADC